MADILIERADGYAVLTLNRPEAKNALSRELRATLLEAVCAIANDPSVHVLILTGAGDAFCAGLDLKELGGSEDNLREVFDEKESPVDALAHFRGPVIGAINGAAITGGFELALGCDLLIASENAQFADTHGRVGLLPLWGLSQRLGRLIGLSRAKELSLTGNFIDARQACAWGLVNRVVQPADLLPEARAIARHMLSLAPEILTSYKHLINKGHAMAFGPALAFEKREALAFNRSVGFESIEARRRAVLERGRRQSNN